MRRNNEVGAVVPDRGTVTTSGATPSSFFHSLFGSLLGGGSIGLVLGFAVPAFGTAAEGGLVLYFLCAAGVHIRARDTQRTGWVYWAAFISLGVAALAVGFAHPGPA